MLLQAMPTTELVSRSLEVDPFNGIAYGLLVAILLAFAIFKLYQDRKKWEWSNKVLEKLDSLNISMVKADVENKHRDNRLESLEKHLEIIQKEIKFLENKK